MARTNKNFSAKRSDILNKVWDIFLTNGYEHTTLALILRELNLSKGVFYHYFATKEECAKAAVDLYSGILVEKTIQNCQAHAHGDQSPVQTLKLLFEQGNRLLAENPLGLEGLHSSANRVFHQMLMVSLTKKLAPVFCRVIQEGVDATYFHTAYPLQMAEMMLVLSNFYFDTDFFEWEQDSLPLKVDAYKQLIADGLGVAVSELFS